jgi:Sec7-like guanine-nucleotide exchange factor
MESCEIQTSDTERRRRDTDYAHNVSRIYFLPIVTRRTNAIVRQVSDARRFSRNSNNSLLSLGMITRATRPQ